MEAATDLPTRPCPFSLLAATFALMTRYASPMPDARICEHRMRSLLARKIVSNLFFLKHHPDLPVGFGQVVTNVHAQWEALAQGTALDTGHAQVATVLH
ncbi:hypothetical protein [Nitrogeniibacter aestuarii]|uniref:hypothetical protein n=1 Tax=Nitrogeniibacter aestuarii TaxID=2815343 RepID=UPI001E456F62|nr:hypothetical protein [Nitrogeniibacter aestuarii]